MQGLMMHCPLTISTILDHAVRANPEREIVSVEADGTRLRLSYQAMAVRARQAASLLLELGVGAGDRVATLAWNSHRHLELYYAIPGIGAVCHTVNPRLDVATIGRIVADAQDGVLFFDADFLEIARALKDRSLIRRFIMLGPAGASIPDWPELLHYEEALAVHAPLPAWPVLDERQAAGLCYTSGTTGNPKGVLYSHRSTVLHALVCALPANMDIRESDSVVPVVPMFHINAWGLPYIALLAGARLVLPRNRLDGASLTALFQAEGVSVAVGVPTIWTHLAEHLRTTGEKLPSLRRLMLGGAALPGPLLDYFEGQHGIEMVQGWGMTETSAVATMGTLRPDMADRTSAERRAIKLKQGRPVYGVELHIADGSEGVGITPGELLVRGPGVASGYFGGSVAFGSWMPTGDIAEIDTQGYLAITDRAKDLIKSGGEWISPTELEQLACQVDGVSQASAIAIPHTHWGERPLLVVRRQPGAIVDASTILAHLERHLQRWQMPDRVEFVDAMPMGATGKILKAELRRHFPA